MAAWWQEIAAASLCAARRGLSCSKPNKLGPASPDHREPVRAMAARVVEVAGPQATDCEHWYRGPAGEARESLPSQRRRLQMSRSLAYRSEHCEITFQRRCTLEFGDGVARGAAQ